MQNIDISSSYAKILGETNFHTREFPRSGSKAKDGEREKKERLNYGNNNGQLRIANTTSGGARKAAWDKMLGSHFGPSFLERCGNWLLSVINT